MNYLHSLISHLYNRRLGELARAAHHCCYPTVNLSEEIFEAVKIRRNGLDCVCFVSIHKKSKDSFDTNSKCLGFIDKSVVPLNNGNVENFLEIFLRGGQSFYFESLQIRHQ